MKLAGTLRANGFKPNPRDICIFQGCKRYTIVVYVDDLMMTSTDRSLVLEMEQILLKKYHQNRASFEKTLSYLGCRWDFHEEGIEKESQVGMIQDLVASRENFHKDRGTEFTGKPLSPAAPYLFGRTPDATLLSIADAKIFHTHVATALYLANWTRPLIGPIGKLYG
jgi:hypothetical protein